MEKEKIEKLKQKLLSEKEALETELEDFAKRDPNLKYNWDAKHPKREENEDAEEEADNAEEYDNLISLEQNLELKLKDVEIALEKISKEEYGICEKCNNPIEEERLMVYPEARLCLDCNK